MILSVVVRGFYENDLAIPVRLYFDQDDPSILTVTFLNGAEEVPWQIGRELISDGLEKPSGTGDVVVSPTRSDNRIAIHLSTPSGRASIMFDKQVLDSFLKATYALVPPGSEFESLDWDILLRE